MKFEPPKVGDVVEAIKNGGFDATGYPRQRPQIGHYYRITSIYNMSYGLGCTLVGMNPAPYRGYFLYVKPGKLRAPAGWYFRPIEKADPEFTATLYEYLESKHHEPVRDRS
jgi:hypothetical protein